MYSDLKLLEMADLEDMSREIFADLAEEHGYSRNWAISPGFSFASFPDFLERAPQMAVVWRPDTKLLVEEIWPYFSNDTYYWSNFLTRSLDDNDEPDRSAVPTVILAYLTGKLYKTSNHYAVGYGALYQALRDLYRAMKMWAKDKARQCLDMDMVC